MDHDRIHARKPPVDAETWRTGRIREVGERDGHCVVTVEPEADDGDADDPGTVELIVTFAVRELFVSRLDAEDPVGERVWFKRRGR
jgi:hypothetical protein